TKWLDTCSTQISSHFSCLIFSLHKVFFKTLSNFLGSLQKRCALFFVLSLDGLRPYPNFVFHFSTFFLLRRTFYSLQSKKTPSSPKWNSPFLCGRRCLPGSRRRGGADCVGAAFRRAKAVVRF
ncbi:MAG: hypothetical protein IJL52_00980, partial [Clostridia bacterium]|nr:hypothetical protein [Clostridia bacterium]